MARLQSLQFRLSALIVAVTFAAALFACLRWLLPYWFAPLWVPSIFGGIFYVVALWWYSLGKQTYGPVCLLLVGSACFLLAAILGFYAILSW